MQGLQGLRGFFIVNLIWEAYLAYIAYLKKCSQCHTSVVAITRGILLFLIIYKWLRFILHIESPMTVLRIWFAQESLSNELTQEVKFLRLMGKTLNITFYIAIITCKFHIITNFNMKRNNLLNDYWIGKLIF